MGSHHASLWAPAGVVKIADFGVADQCSTITRRQTTIGTPHWMAPEVVAATEEGGYGSKVDVWSLGIAVIEVRTLETPPSHQQSDLSATAT